MNDKTVFRALQLFDLESRSMVVHKGIYRVSTPRGEKCLKKVNFGPEDINFISAAMEYVINNGFPNIAAYEKSPSGLPYVEVDGAYFVVTPWINGRESDYTRLPDLGRAARALAQFHQAGRGFRPSSFLPRIRWGQWPEIFQTRWRELEDFTKQAHKRKRPFDRAYAKNAPYYLKQAYRSLEILDRSPYKKLVAQAEAEGALCHHDYAYHNVLLAEDGQVYLLDFDYSVCDLPIHDLASLIVRTMKWNDWNFRRVPYIINIYNSLAKLDKNVFPVIYGFLTFPQDFFQLGVWRYMENMPWTEKSFGRKMSRILKMKKGRERFLEAFQENYC